MPLTHDRRGWEALTLGLFLLGCGDATLGAPAPDAVASADPVLADGAVAPPDAGRSPDSGTPADVGEPESVDVGPDVPLSEPEPTDPCAVADCWDTSAAAAPCSTRVVDEDFSTGRYNVHAWETTVHAGLPARIALERTAGAWQPALVVLDTLGRALAEEEAEVVRDGREGARAEVAIHSAGGLRVVVHVTSWAAVESGFEARLPADATYRLGMESDCGDEPPRACVVNGHAVREPACGWLRFTAREVVPRLEGEREARLTTAARVAWWSLKEGVYYLDNPLVYSNCNFPDGDRRIGPLDVCVARRAWQVGLAAVQVPWHDLAQVEATASRLYPADPLADVLARTAARAGLDPAQTDAVVAARGELRKSWLLRDSAVGFTHEAPVITRECIDDERPWCFGSGWDTTRWFAPDHQSAMRSIADIRAMFDALAP